MLIALDYDGTYTLDPAFWAEFISNVRARGHKVICATMRNDDEVEEVRRVMWPHAIPVYHTRRMAKGPALAAAGIFPDIWIDDRPQWIARDAA
jgi:hypothetical protein